MAKKIRRSSNKSKAALGDGINALLTNMAAENAAQREQAVKTLANKVLMLPIAQIEANKEQPRTEFEQEPLEELAQSIRTHGLIQPVTVRRISKDRYQLVSGERRWRASQLAQLEAIPAYIRVVDNDQDLLEMALIENVQREQLNPVEIASTYKRLMDECELTQEKLSERIGKNRVTIAQYLRLLKLSPDMLEALKNKTISMGHAKALIGIDDISIQRAVFNEATKNGLSVRATEALANAYKNDVGAAGNSAPKSSGTLPDDYERVERELRNFFGSKQLKIKLKTGGKGQIVIPFDRNNDNLNRLLDLIN